MTLSLLEKQCMIKNNKIKGKIMGLFSKLLGKKVKGEMADPMDGLKELQKAIDNGLDLLPCEIYSDISMIVDKPDNKPRLTYVKTDATGHIIAYCVYLFVDPIDGVICFSIGYAVPPKYRHEGLGSEIIKKSIDELKNGFKRQGRNEFYIEAVISADNHISQKLAQKLISTEFKKINDGYSGQPAYHYTKLVRL